MNFDPNDLYHEILDFYADNRKDANGKGQKVVICNEGSTRSSKTWDFFHLLVTFCDHNRNKGNKIYIFRDKLVNCRDFTLLEFESCLKEIGIWDQSKFRSSPKPYYNLYGNDVYFRGLDNDAEAFPSDICFFNESLEMQKEQVSGLVMRCRKLVVYDWNPKFTQHWCFDLEGQPNTFFTHSTFRNNKHLQDSIIAGILSYEPWLPGSYEVINKALFYKGKPIDDKNQPPPHPVNTVSLKGAPTADEFKWKVYGLGLRGSMEGVIFKNVVYDDVFPDLDFIYGNDFGYTTHPNAVVKYTETEADIYVELLHYKPVKSPSELNELYTAIGIDIEKIIIADSSDKFSNNEGTKEFVYEMYVFGWKMVKVSKTENIMFHIGKMQEKQIHIIKDKKGLWMKAKHEAENYIMKQIHGYEVNTPVDKWNHFWDTTRYCFMEWGAGSPGI